MNLACSPREAVTLLAIESSCDETGASVIQDGRILSNIIAGQPVHERYGGVVPELASRAHLQHIIPVVQSALEQAGTRKEDLSAIAFTRSPGLIGALLVGSGFAHSMAQALGLPLIGINHLQAHVLSNLIREPRPSFPFLCLTVSGGHTQIVLCSAPLRMEILGETMDDAAGETFDKTAKLFGLPYPGGPLIDRYAALGNPERFAFPEPRVPGLDFSFSGLKTAILYFVQEQQKKDSRFIQDNLNDLCASVQGRIISILLHKMEGAACQTGIREICIAGGVSANSGLRLALGERGAALGWNTYWPPLEYCTDNAAMIAYAAYHKFLGGIWDDLSVVPSARGLWQ